MNVQLWDSPKCFRCKHTFQSNDWRKMLDHVKLPDHVILHDPRFPGSHMT